MTLYSNTLASHSYRFKRLMLAYRDTEIEQLLRDARLLFEKLDKVLDAPTAETEDYRLALEQVVDLFKSKEDISTLKIEISDRNRELNELI